MINVKNIKYESSTTKHYDIVFRVDKLSMVVRNAGLRACGADPIIGDRPLSVSVTVSGGFGIGTPSPSVARASPLLIPPDYIRTLQLYPTAIIYFNTLALICKYIYFI